MTDLGSLYISLCWTDCLRGKNIWSLRQDMRKEYKRYRHRKRKIRRGWKDYLSMILIRKEEQRRFCGKIY